MVPPATAPAVLRRAGAGSAPHVRAAAPSAVLPLLLMAVAALPGCLDETAPVPIAWQVRNQSNGTIDYVVSLDGGLLAHTRDGRLGPSHVAHHEMAVTGTDFTARAQLRDDDRASAGVPFAVDGLCRDYRIVAVWDGRAWTVDAAATDCG